MHYMKLARLSTIMFHIRQRKQGMWHSAAVQGLPLVDCIWLCFPKGISRKNVVQEQAVGMSVGRTEFAGMPWSVRLWMIFSVQRFDILRHTTSWLCIHLPTRFRRVSQQAYSEAMACHRYRLVATHHRTTIAATNTAPSISHHSSPLSHWKRKSWLSTCLHFS